MDPRNIILIGMPGAGKSTTGVVLAKVLNMQFIDTDLILQQKEKMPLQDIINLHGISQFLNIEEMVVGEIRTSNTVIATGGSVVYSNCAMTHLMDNNSVVVYLQLEYQEIKSRISNYANRGIILPQNKSLHDLYKERIPLYETYADFTIRCSDKDLEMIILEIKNRYMA